MLRQSARHAYVLVDVFTRERLRGNPVAVFFDSDDLPAGTMQRIAQEMHLSETTFVLRPRAGGDAHIRIFTPVNELPFAGHPLLGTAVALGDREPGPRADRDRLLLETAVGTVPFTLDREDGRVVAARMRQPLPTWRPFDRTEELLKALGIARSTLPVEIYVNGPRHVLVGLEDVAALSALDPDHRALAAFEDMAVNCFAGSGAHWRLRMFSPAYGVVEDAGTGSAAGPLLIHLLRHGAVTSGRSIEILQGVELGRGSRMLATAEGSGTRVDAVDVGGDGVIVGLGTLFV